MGRPPWPDAPALGAFLMVPEQTFKTTDFRDESRRTNLARACRAGAASCRWERAHGFGPELGAQGVDQGEVALALDMPEGPAVAGFEALRQRADAVDRADGVAECDRAIGAHQRLVAALGLIGV